MFIVWQLWGGECDKVPAYDATLGKALAEEKKMLPDAYINVVNCLANNDTKYNDLYKSKNMCT